MTNDGSIPEKGGPLTEPMRRRLMEGLERKGWNKRDLSFNVRIGETTVGAIINGKQAPTFANLMTILDALGMNIGYVVGGFLPKFIDEEPSSSSSIRPAVSSLGVDAWLQDQPAGSLTAEEVEYMRAALIPQPEKRHSDSVYQVLLSSYRHASTLAKHE